MSVPGGKAALLAALALTAVTVFAPTAPPASATTAGSPSSAGSAPGSQGGVLSVRIDGRGDGHGVGLSQDGELAMGEAGDSTGAILGQFYPGTSMGHASGPVRVVVLDAAPSSSGAGSGTSAATVLFPGGGQIQDATSGPQSPGFPLKVPAGDAATLSLSNGTYTATVSGPVSAQSASPAVVAAATPGPTGSPAPAGTGRAVVVAAATSSTTTTTTEPGLHLVPTTSTTVPHLTPPSTTTTTTPLRKPAASTTTTTTPPPSTAPPTSASSGRPLWAVPSHSGLTDVTSTGRRYRGIVEALGAPAQAGSGTDLDLVNQLDVDQYLRGMGEVQDPSWPQASLRAQAIIERTYALRAMQAAGEICDDTRCQVYLGEQAEYGAQDEAVSATAGQVLTYGGDLAATVFSANGGGYSATPQEGFGPDAGTYPYLRAAPYPTNFTDPWSITVSLASVASRLDYQGTLTSAAVSTTGPSGRALTVSLLGSAGPETVPGITFADQLGLQSTLFELHDFLSSTAPAAPPPAQDGQALPTDASALAAAVASPANPPGNGSGSASSHDHGRSHSGPGGRSALGPLHGTGRRSGPSPLAWLGLVLLLAVAAGSARQADLPRRTAAGRQPSTAMPVEDRHATSLGHEPSALGLVASSLGIVLSAPAALFSRFAAADRRETRRKPPTDHL